MSRGFIDMMAYFAVAENESIERVRLGLIEVSGDSVNRFEYYTSELLLHMHIY